MLCCVLIFTVLWKLWIWCKPLLCLVVVYKAHSSPLALCFVMSLWGPKLWTLSAAMCDCSASVQVWQALLKCIFVWCSIYALLLVVLLHRLAIPHPQDQSSISVCLFKMPGCSGCKHSPSLCAVPGCAQPTQLTWDCTSIDQEPVSPMLARAA